MNTVEDLIHEYRNEVSIAASSFYAWKSIHNLAASDNEIFQVLNTNALSWNVILHSLQITFFITLGRLFDEDNRSLTVNTFISRCQNGIAQFSKSAFEARRIEDAHGVRPEYLDDYLQGVYEPVAADFIALAQSVSPHETIYNNNYKSIRHKLIAHKDFATIESKHALFAKTDIGEIEEILQFLHQIERVVAELHINGRKTNLNEHALAEERYIHEDLKKLFGGSSQNSEFKQEHKKPGEIRRLP
jgi:hypothetical protein